MWGCGWYVRGHQTLGLAIPVCGIWQLQPHAVSGHTRGARRIYAVSNLKKCDEYRLMPPPVVVIDSICTSDVWTNFEERRG